MNSIENREPAGSALAFGVVAIGVFGAVALVVAFLVAHPKTTTVAPVSSSTSESSSASAATPDATTLAVSLREFHIDASSTMVTPGVKTLEIDNAGTVQHELLVFRSDLAPNAYPIDPTTGDINEDAAGLTKVSDGDNLDPSANQSRAVDLSQPGTYTFVCNLPGHFRSGMVTTFTVAPVLPSAAITLTDFHIGSGSAHFAPAQYDFSIANGGPSQHELLVFRTDLAPANFPRNSDGSVQENAAGLNKVSDGDNIDPGKIQARTVDLTEPGTYVLLCNLPGHFANGMYATITVSP